MSSAQINVARSIHPERPSLIARAAGIALTSCLWHWMFWIWVGVLCYVGLITASLSQPAAVHARWAWPFLALYTGALVPSFFVGHLASHRAHLVPHYRRVHVWAMAICGLGMFGLLTSSG